MKAVARFNSLPLAFKIMGRRSIALRKLNVLDRPEKLEELSAFEDLKLKAFPDATADVPGTTPEKMVYNYLLSLGIRFQYQYSMEDIDSTAFPEEIYRPDFTLPDYNSKIEVFGLYWHTLPHRSDSDLKKMARNLLAGRIIIQNGIPTFPEGGGYTGKFVIWWENEIYADLAFLFARDFSELFSPHAIKGVPDEYLLNKEEERQKLLKARARMSVARMRPELLPFQRLTRKLTKKIFDLNETYPILRELGPVNSELVPKNIKKLLSQRNENKIPKGIFA